MTRYSRLIWVIFALGWFTGIAPAADPQTPAIPNSIPAAADPSPGGYRVLDGTFTPGDTHAWQLLGGASLYIVKPYFQGNTAFTTNTGANTLNGAQEVTPFSWDYAASPGFWLGVVSPCGLGVRASYFNFDQSSNSMQTSLTPDRVNTFVGPAPDLAIPPGAGFGSPGAILTAGFGRDQLEFNSNLTIHHLDLEVMQQWQFGHLGLIVSGGGCYLEMSQNYSGNLVNNVTFADNSTANEIQHLSFGQNFQGGGPTLAAEGRIQMGGSGLCLFTQLRGTLLVGTTHQSFNLLQDLNDPNGNVGGTRSATYATNSHEDHMMSVAEIELGMEYSWHLGNLTSCVRAALVDKTYFDAGNASQQSGNISLFGAQLSFGLNY